MESVDLSLMESGGDNIYLLRYAAHPVVLVVTGAGVIDRSIALPDPGEGFRLFSMRVGTTQLIVQYVKDTPDGALTKYAAVDRLTGDVLTEYVEASDVHGQFACYDWNGGFTFIGSGANFKAVLKASAR